MGKLGQQTADNATRADGLPALTQDDQGPTDGRPFITRRARGTRLLSRRSVRRGLWGAGALVALGALGVSALVFGGSGASNASDAAAKLDTSAVGSTALSPGSPEVISHALASENAQSARKAAAKHLKRAKKPKATTSATAAAPKTSKSAPAVKTSAPSSTSPSSPTGSSQPTAPSSASSGPPPSSTPVTASGDPSGESPATSLSGFTQDYVQEFTGNSIPSGWDAYTGVPGGSSSQEAQWTPSMCDFSGGEAHFEASGVDSCGLQYYGTPQIYGAWFARIKADAMPSGVAFGNVFLLFPANNEWPPEIDIYEDHATADTTVESMYNTVGNACGSNPTGSCLAPYGQSNGQQGGTVNNNDEWHTYGVEWTPSGVTWLIDGNVVFTAPASAVQPPAAQPDTPMYMDLQEQNITGTTGTPNQIETMSVDWVQEFSWNG
jgi:hypothetical protein